MTVDTDLRLRDGTNYPVLLTTVLVPPLLVLLQLEVAYALVHPACNGGGKWPLQVSFALAILITGAISLVGWRESDRWEPLSQHDPSGRAARSWFLAALGAFLSSLSTLVLIAQWLATLFLNPCQ
jgi:hypothetical protein